MAAVLPDADDDKVTNHVKIDIQMAIDAAVKRSPKLEPFSVPVETGWDHVPVCRLS